MTSHTIDRVMAHPPDLTASPFINHRRIHVDLATAIEQLFGDIETAAQTIAPLVAVIGFISLGVMYMGSSLPFLADWKKDNPKAANQVIMGLLFVIFASSVTTLITF
jgi:hypothetical protein